MIEPILNNPTEGQIKAILNGGKDELDCAIVPFTFGFSEEIISKKPTHVLVIDRTKAEAERELVWRDETNQTRSGKRYFFDLSSPGNHFIEFFKSGDHNLLFLFFNYSVLNKMEIARWKETFLKKNEYYKTYYEYEFASYNLTKVEYYRPRFIGFCEKDVNIPVEFFSTAPQGFLGKAFYNWVNKWRRDKPTDDCDFRDRALRALTYELIPRIGYFLVMNLGYSIVRFIWAFLITMFVTIFKTTLFLSGAQNKNFTKGFKKLWKEYVIDNNLDFDETVGIYDSVDNGDSIYNYKEIHIGGKTFNTPISVFGLAVFSSFIYLFISSASNGYLNSTLFSFILVLIHSCIIVESSALINKFRDKKLFKLQFSFGNGGEAGVIKYDLFTKACFYFIGYTLSILIVYNLFHLGIVQAVFSAVFSKTGLFVASLVTTVVLLVVFGRNITNKIKVAFEKLLQLFFKVLYFIWKPIDALLYKSWMKFDAYIQKKFPPAPKTEEVSSGDVYKDWLKTSYNLDKTPTTITASTLPKAQTTKGRIVQTFKTKFWDTKSKICRPYEH